MAETGGDSDGHRVVSLEQEIVGLNSRRDRGKGINMDFIRHRT